MTEKAFATGPKDKPDLSIKELHQTDESGNPAGGSTEATGVRIHWQNGPLGLKGAERKEQNGAFVETVIMAGKGRLEFYQGGKFACEHNAEAIKYLDLALKALESRTEDREKRGVEGTHAL